MGRLEIDGRAAAATGRGARRGTTLPDSRIAFAPICAEIRTDAQPGAEWDNQLIVPTPRSHGIGCPTGAALLELTAKPLRLRWAPPLAS